MRQLDQERGGDKDDDGKKVRETDTETVSECGRETARETE